MLMHIIKMVVVAIVTEPAGSCVYIHRHALPGFGEGTEHDRGERYHPGRDVAAG